MAFNTTNSVGQIAAWLEDAGYVDEVVIGEPKAPPEGNVAAIFMVSETITQLYLNGGTQELHVIQARLYRNMLKDNEDNELKLAFAVSNIRSSLLADFELNGEIRNIDAAGEFGQALTATYGYVDASSVMYRIVDILIPLIVDDSATASP